MYVTKRLSEYQRNPSELTLLPTEGPNSGVLVIQDQESQPTCCFGKCFDCDLHGLLLPQNTKVTVKYQIGTGDDRIVLLDPVAFIPVLHQPLSSNLYYVIRRSGKHTGRLSEFQRIPLELEQPPPDGPNSGVLVIQDEESRPISCFGLCYDEELRGLPFPQNAKLAVRFSDGEDSNRDPVLFIPVLDQPLSSNRYYVIIRRGKHSGEASASAKEENRTPYCFCFSYVPEAKPQQVDPYNIYQQFEIHQRNSPSRYYSATSVAPNGVPPWFLKREDWTVEYSTSQDFGLKDDAKGINTKLRSELPGDLNTSVVVGKWYVPFIFVKQRDTKAQMKRSTYYSMTLKQRWEEVYSCGNVDYDEEDGEVVVDVEVESELVKLEGQVIGKETRSVDENGVVWFEIADKKIGLRSMIVERMNWEEERFGWSKKTDDLKSSIKRSVRFEGDAMLWQSYKCHVLVESFELKRMDGSMVLTFEFRHVDKLKNKWD